MNAKHDEAVDGLAQLIPGLLKAVDISLPIGGIQYGVCTQSGIFRVSGLSKTDDSREDVHCAKRLDTMAVPGN